MLEWDNRFQPGGWRLALGALIVMYLTGCGASGPVPWGPGAATETDLRPWLENAPTVTFVGCLQNFNVASQKGSYVTWSVHASERNEIAEVDVRECAMIAEMLKDRRVVISGKLIDREEGHFPLLVAERIEPAASENLTPEQDLQLQLVMLGMD